MSTKLSTHYKYFNTRKVLYFTDIFERWVIQFINLFTRKNINGPTFTTRPIPHCLVVLIYLVTRTMRLYDRSGWLSPLWERWNFPYLDTFPRSGLWLFNHYFSPTLPTVQKSPLYVSSFAVFAATGQSRGFAFVEFQSVADSQRWMEQKQVDERIQ